MFLPKCRPQPPALSVLARRHTCVSSSPRPRPPVITMVVQPLNALMEGVSDTWARSGLDVLCVSYRLRRILAQFGGHGSALRAWRGWFSRRAPRQWLVVCMVGGDDARSYRAPQEELLIATVPSQLELFKQWNGNASVCLCRKDGDAGRSSNLPACDLCIRSSAVR